MLIEGLVAQYLPNFLALSTNTSVSITACAESPLYQPSIQVSTILISSSPPSRNCLQDIVERSSTSARAGIEDASSAAANSIETVVFIKFSLRFIISEDEADFGICGQRIRPLRRAKSR